MFIFKTLNEEMRTFHRIIGLIAFAGILTVSCTKSDINIYDGTIWIGTYPAQTQNGTTGELEDQTGVIDLEFHDDALVCYVSQGYAGLIGMNRIKYDVIWSGRDSFCLTRTQAEQTIISYSGAISGKSMSLDAYNCDGLARTYSLFRQNQ